MANPRLKRQARKSRGGSEVKLNITSMMDMFTIILVFLLKNFSTQGQMVTPAAGLMLPTSNVEKAAVEALNIKISKNTIVVENTPVTDEKEFSAILKQQEFLIPELHKVLVQYEKEARKSAEVFGKEFKGEITIHGDVSTPYKVITRVMYTCGQAGFPVMNLLVYKRE
jgi:biopolymer transport protein ExbD